MTSFAMAFLSRVLGRRHEPEPDCVAADVEVQPMMVPPKNEHRIDMHRFGFDPSTVTYGSGPRLTYRYEASEHEGAAVYAVGMDGWMPLSLATMMLGVGPQYAVERLHRQMSRNLYVRDAIFTHWEDANREAFARLYQFEPNMVPEDTPDWVTSLEAYEKWEASLPKFMAPGELALEYLMTWDRRFGDAKLPLFMCNTQTYCDYRNRPEIRDMDEANSRAMAMVHEEARAWLTERGFLVDASRGLVNVPEYEAMYVAGYSEW